MKNFKKILIILFLVISIFVPKSIYAKTLDEIYKEVFPNNILEMASVKFNNSADETLVYKTIANFNKLYDGIEFSCEGMFEENCQSELCAHVRIHDGVSSKVFDVSLSFLEPVGEKYELLNSYAKKYPTNGTVEENLFTMEDMEIINYMLNGGFSDSYDKDIVNSIINYSSEVKKLRDNTNIDIYLETRAGWEDEFSAGGFGDLIFLYNGIAYANVYNGGIKGINTIYVPDETEDNRESYIKAAIERIENYIGKGLVTIEYNNQISTIDDDNWVIPLEKLVDINKTLGEYYTLTLKGDKRSFFIVKDSSKIKENPILETKDIDSDVLVVTEDSTVPLDATIKANKKNTSDIEYEKIMKHIGINNGEMYDINLHSSSIEQYIKKLDNGKFKVYIPLNKDYLEKKLFAYYVDDKGNIEKYSINIENGYGVFETNHFSTYTIGESNEITNINIDVPQTFDSITNNLIIFTISIIGLIGAIIYINIKNKVRA